MPGNAGNASSSTQLVASGRDVLVVEDDPRVRKMLGDALKQMGLNATFAFSAEGADKLLGGCAYDVLILDLNLPGMNGIDFLARIRQRGCDVPVIILTGFGDLEAAKKAIHFDVVEFLSKPCTLGSLETAMSRARRRRKGQIIGEAAASGEAAVAFEEPQSSKAAALEEATASNQAEDLSMEAVERRHILAALKKHNGNRTAAANELGISVRKLYYRLGEYQRKGLIS